MTATSNAIPITIVSTDTALLRESSWMLASLGYESVVSSDWSEDAPWRHASEPRLLVLDSRDRKQTKELLGAARRGAFVHRLVVYSRDNPADANELLGLGAEDVISHPVNPCQLLARVRAGARRLEFERRLQAVSLHDEGAGTTSRAGIIRHLETLSDTASSPGQVLLTIGVDHLSLIKREFGEHGAHLSTSSLARCCESSLRHSDFFFNISEGVYGALLSPATEEEGMSLAQSLAAKLSERNSLTRGFHVRLTVSAAVTLWDEGVVAGELLERGVNALQHAQSYGGARVLRTTEVEQEVDQWRKRLETGDLFQEVVAQDFMEAFPVVLPQRDADRAIAAWPVEGTPGVEGLAPPLIPVVCELGTLTGCVRPGTAGVGSPPLTIGRDVPLSELIEELAAAEEGYLAVVDGERPLGYITNEGMASLMMDGLDATTYQTGFDPKAGASSLVIPVEPPPCPVAAAE